MCGRYTLTSDHSHLQARFNFVAQDFRWVPRFNIAPTQPALAVLYDGERHAEMLRWGLIPSWAKDSLMSSRLINARAETVAEKSAFIKPLRKKRCLVLADGFYEWRREAKRKVPMRIILKNGEPFAFAGLWDSWRSPSGETVRSCTIITTGANEAIAAIHNWMPVILPRETESAWLDHSIEDPDIVGSLLAPISAQDMEAYPVSDHVNSPQTDDPSCVTPLAAL